MFLAVSLYLRKKNIPPSFGSVGIPPDLSVPIGLLEVFGGRFLLVLSD